MDRSHTMPIYMAKSRSTQSEIHNFEAFLALLHSISHKLTFGFFKIPSLILNFNVALDDLH